MSAHRSSQEQDQNARQPPEHLVVGRVVRPHGVRGSLVVEPVSRVIDSLQPGSVVFLGESEHAYIIENIRPHRKRFLMTLDGIEDRNEADLYRDLEVRLSYEESEPLDDHEYYYWQILGLKVQKEDGQLLGKVVDIIETGANDVYIVHSDSGEELLLPAIADVILTVDLEASKLIVRLLPGLDGS
ncbi:MAG: ribosome maturation factor RimM [Anaerolineales bacterium]|jgi:16S rRNA processing protein RimM